MSFFPFVKGFDKENGSFYQFEICQKHIFPRDFFVKTFIDCSDISKKSCGVSNVRLLSMLGHFSTLCRKGLKSSPKKYPGNLCQGKIQIKRNQFQQNHTRCILICFQYY